LALASPPAGAATPRLTLKAKPGLFPRFSIAVHDYVVRCRPRTPVRLSFDVSSGTTVRVGERVPRGGRFRVAVDLGPGRAVRLAVRTRARTRAYAIRCLPGGFPRWDVERHRQPQAHYYVVAPRRGQPGSGYAMIIDDRGVPVWWKHDRPAPFNSMLLPDGGIAWTQLTNSRFEPSSGHFDEYALDGAPVRRYVADGGRANQHELSLLPNGHALLITYDPRYHQDLSRWGGPPDVGILDGNVQELDAAGRRVWGWSTHGHVGLAETEPWFHKLLFTQKPIATPGGDVYDTEHLNSLEPRGDRLVLSLRHTNGVYEVDRRSGRVNWKLGGTRTARSLTVVGDRHDSHLDGQHDPRLLDHGRRLTVFDNGTLHRRPPRALELRIDRRRRRAKVVSAVEFRRARVSTCCGSARRLPGGHWVIAWGNTEWVTELTGSGKPVLVLRFRDRTTYRAQPVLGGRLTRGRLRDAMDAMVR
jgi:hypothetical protein